MEVNMNFIKKKYFKNWLSRELIDIAFFIENEQKKNMASTSISLAEKEELIKRKLNELKEIISGDFNE